MSLEKNYVVQEHRAKKAGKHHDLRLERYGTLKSWAVPKGVPLRSEKRVLAVPTEDHSKHWLRFEGRIPEGQYGHGVVKIWDRGKYKPLEWTNDKIKFEVTKGKKMNGIYTMIKIKSGNWIIMKNKKKIPSKKNKPY
jgi:bifunctional non-homologous end joining protein LigD